MHAGKYLWVSAARANLSMLSGSGRKSLPRRVHGQLTFEVAAASDEAVVREDASACHVRKKNVKKNPEYGHTTLNKVVHGTMVT